MTAESQKDYILSVIPSKEEFKVSNAGIFYYPNWKLQQARENNHSLNVLLIGPPGVGKSTFVASIFGQSIPFRQQQNGELSFKEAQVELVEGSVNVNLKVNILMGFDSSSCLEDLSFKNAILNHVNNRHLQAFSLEASPTRPSNEILTDLFDFIFYFVPPTFQQFSTHEINFFGELQKMTTIIPIISKADMYTKEELKRLKLLIRAQFEANDLLPLPSANEIESNEYLRDEFVQLIANWPFAIVGSCELKELQDGSKLRGRSYPWGFVDADNEEFSDLYCVEALIISSFYISNKIHLRYLFEHIWRPFFMNLNQPNIRGNLQQFEQAIQENQLLPLNSISLSIDEASEKINCAVNDDCKIDLDL